MKQPDVFIPRCRCGLDFVDAGTVRAEVAACVFTTNGRRAICPFCRQKLRIVRYRHVSGSLATTQTGETPMTVVHVVTCDEGNPNAQPNAGGDCVGYLWGVTVQQAIDDFGWERRRGGVICDACADKAEDHSHGGRRG